MHARPKTDYDDNRGFFHRHWAGTAFTLGVICLLIAGAGVLKLFFNVPQPPSSALPVAQVQTIPTPAASPLSDLRELMAVKTQMLKTSMSSTSKYPYNYTVVSGDWLSKIAQAAYGNPDDWTFIYYANHLTSTTILPQQILIIPAPNGAPPAPPGPPTPAVTVAAASNASPPNTSGGVGGAFGACVRARENGNSYSWSTGNGGGAYQFLESTWIEYGGTAANFGNASPAVQDQIFLNAIAAGGQNNWAPYDGC